MGDISADAIANVRRLVEAEKLRLYRSQSDWEDAFRDYFGRVFDVLAKGYQGSKQGIELIEFLEENLSAEILQTAWETDWIIGRLNKSTESQFQNLRDVLALAGVERNDLSIRLDLIYSLFSLDSIIEQRSKHWADLESQALLAESAPDDSGSPESSGAAAEAPLGTSSVGQGDENAEGEDSTADRENTEPDPPTKGQHRSINPELAALRAIVLKLHEERLSHEDICRRLDSYKHPRPPQSKWSHLSWHQAYMSPQFGPSVRTWISKAIEKAHDSP